MGEHIFVSYSWQDRDYVYGLYAQMQAQGLKPWIYERDEGSALPYIKQLLAVIADARAVLVVLPRSMASTVVSNEITEAFRRAPILPLLLEEGDGEVAFQLRHLNWIDARANPYPVAQIAQTLDHTLSVQLPAVRLKAVAEHAHLVTPAEITLEIPFHAWANLFSDPAYEYELCTIGTLRDRKLVVSLDLQAVSRRHAHLTVRRDADGLWHYTLYDTSRNGTWVDGNRIAGSHELGTFALIGLVGDTLLIQYGAYDQSTLDANPSNSVDPKRNA